MPPKGTILVPTLERFFNFISPEPNTGCWLWTGSTTTPNGYGKLKMGADAGGPREKLAHVFAYEHFVGPIPEGLELDHLCRVRCCANYQHLEPVTASTNVRRGIRPTRTREYWAIFRGRSYCKRGHLLSPDNLIASAPNKSESPRCRTCHNDLQRERKRRQYAQRKLLCMQNNGSEKDCA